MSISIKFKNHQYLRNIHHSSKNLSNITFSIVFPGLGKPTLPFRTLVTDLRTAESPNKTEPGYISR